MGKVLETAYEEVKKSQFIIDDKNTNYFEVQNAFIFWTNFAGKPNQFGNTAKTFNLAVNADMAAWLMTKGFRVREEVVGQILDEATGKYVDAKVYFVNIKVNFESEWPPVVKLFTEYKGQKVSKVLDSDTAGQLDAIDIKSCDLKVHASPSKKFPGKCSGYLNRLYVIQEPSVIFGGKYDDWEETNVNDAKPADLLGTSGEDDNY